MHRNSRISHRLSCSSVGQGGNRSVRYNIGYPLFQKERSSLPRDWFGKTSEHDCSRDGNTWVCAVDGQVLRVLLLCRPGRVDCGGESLCGAIWWKNRCFLCLQGKEESSLQTKVVRKRVMSSRVTISTRPSNVKLAADGINGSVRWRERDELSGTRTGGPSRFGGYRKRTVHDWWQECLGGQDTTQVASFLTMGCITQAFRPFDYKGDSGGSGCSGCSTDGAGCDGEGSAGGVSGL